ncbi:MAG: MFS transporter [Candidatus Carbobacillus altaicus]|nr:MFS transporter [Candidatus Carbobacillus altaicus]
MHHLSSLYHTLQRCIIKENYKMGAMFVIKLFSSAQLYLFLFLLSGALGTFLGGPLADRIGKKNVLFYSMLLSLPFSLLLPYLPPTGALMIVPLLGFILLSSFSVSVVYAQDLFPGHVGVTSGLTIGLAFGLGALGAVALGVLVDWIGITQTIIAMSFLPLLGLTASKLPDDNILKKWA